MATSRRKYCACCGRSGDSFRALPDNLREFVNDKRMESGKPLIDKEALYRNECFKSVLSLYTKFLKTPPAAFATTSTSQNQVSSGSFGDRMNNPRWVILIETILYKSLFVFNFMSNKISCQQSLNILLII